MENRSHIAPWSIDHVTNVGQLLSETASRMPESIAVAGPDGKVRHSDAGSIRYQTITFAELEAESNRAAAGMIERGIGEGDRIALMVPPGLSFVTMVFALFKTRATIILIDPGMGRKNMVRCLAEARPNGFVGIQLAHVARLLFRKRFPSATKNFVVDGWFPGCHRVSQFKPVATPPSDAEEGLATDEAAIIFTTGSTGPPKGVLYRHQTFIQQAAQIRDWFDIQPGTVDVSGFPLFALFNTAMGATTVFPEMDATRPADVHPPFIIDAVERFKADQSFGSPALWNTMAMHCESNDVKLPTIRRVLTAGAPVPQHVLKRVKSIIADDGEVFTPYGATEALPVACNSASMVIGETGAATDEGAGTCVGNRFPAMNWRVIPISDEPIADIGGAQSVGVGEIGELIVQGVVVTDQYVTQTDANADHKIADGESFWHRMGDVGYLDDHDRFWFCGRKSHRVRTEDGDMFTVPCESIMNTHPAIYRSALVGVGEPGAQVPALIAQPWPDHWPAGNTESQALIQQLKELAAQHSHTKSIRYVFLHESLPVDIRHNSKIFREQLRPWAAARMTLPS